MAEFCRAYSSFFNSLQPRRGDVIAFTSIDKYNCFSISSLQRYSL